MPVGCYGLTGAVSNVPSRRDPAGRAPAALVTVSRAETVGEDAEEVVLFPFPATGPADGVDVLAVDLVAAWHRGIDPDTYSCSGNRMSARMSTCTSAATSKRRWVTRRPAGIGLRVQSTRVARGAPC